MMSLLLTSWRQQRRLVVALISCALLFTGLLTWNSLANHRRAYSGSSNSPSMHRDAASAMSRIPWILTHPDWKQQHSSQVHDEDGRTKPRSDRNRDQWPARETGKRYRSSESRQQGSSRRREDRNLAVDSKKVIANSRSRLSKNVDKLDDTLYEEREDDFAADSKNVSIAVRRTTAASVDTGIGSEYGPGGSKRSPLLGALRGGPGHCHVHSTADDLPELEDFAAGVDCLDLATNPSVVVCPYPDSDDRHLSQPLRMHGVWEPHLVRLFQAALLTDRQLGVYDVGSNIGQYALLAAAMGRHVVAVEPYRRNVYRLHKAVRLGRFEKQIVIVANAVSDERETFELQLTEGNPSGVQLTNQDADRFCPEPECPPHASTILLDDLLEVTNFAAAVMKLDVEGYEHRALRHANELLTDVRVDYIFMEWTRMRELYGAEVDDTADKRLVQRLVDSLAGRNYTAYGVVELRPLDRRAWYAWPHDVLWVRADAVEPRRLAAAAPELPSRWTRKTASIQSQMNEYS